MTPKGFEDMPVGAVVVTMRTGAVVRGRLVRENFEGGHRIVLADALGAERVVDVRDVAGVEADEDAPPVVMRDDD